MAYRQFAQVYDRLMADMPYKEWLEFASHCWELYGKPGIVADLGCGTGTISIPLAESGLKVYGIDLSEDMLAAARAKSEAKAAGNAFPGGGQTLWVQQDMREWELPEEADAAVSFCDCLNYLTEEADVKAFFRQTFRGVRSGGLFVFDVHTPTQLHNYADSQPFVLDEEDVAYIWTCGFDGKRCEIEHALTFFVRDEADGRFNRFEEIHVQRAYPLSWLKEQLVEAGFAEVRMYADFTWDEPDSDTERAFFVAVKK